MARITLIYPTTNGIRFDAEGHALPLFWLAGGRLYLMFGSSLVPIENPVANGTYDTRAEATAAAQAFFDLSDASEYVEL